MKIEELYSIFKSYPKIVTDSRCIEDNSIFFALKGENFDGNKFALKALELGAKYSVVDDTSLNQNDNFIYVDNVLKCLQQLAAFHRDQFKIPIIGITGTNGKTTTKELINTVLKQKLKTHATKGNLNNHIGVPLTLLEMPYDTKIAIIEMGANHQEEIKELCEIAKPNFGIITNIGKAHLEGFGSFEGVIKAKKELYDFVGKDGRVFLNSDNKLLTELAENLSSIKYGANQESDCFAQIIDINPFVKLRWNNLEIQSNLIGKYNFENILAAICIGNYFGVQPTEIKMAIERYIPQNNRSQIVQTKTNKLILDAYNANPTSMSSAIESFELLKPEIKVVILGDMLELGKESIKEHQEILNKIATLGFVKTFLVGPVFYSLAKNSEFIAFENNIEALEYLKINPISDSTILIKGSRGIKLEILLDVL
ncbi:MAG: UDP-N-acetylmuramoyl-tripeptide--D-alanyl-D-alanine ligase [Saprospiraceae bacterium]|nr:UDP-N-acetylmuramoyl-tripeptide--D-alanyl-D-alanine ligase [Saprospiraceae bacterium]